MTTRKLTEVDDEGLGEREAVKETTDLGDDNTEDSRFPIRCIRLLGSEADKSVEFIRSYPG